MEDQELVDINLDTETRRKRLKRRLLRVFIPVGCVLFMVATILSITAYGYYINRRDTLGLSDYLLDSLDRRIAVQVKEYLSPASKMVGCGPRSKFPIMVRYDSPSLPPVCPS